MVLPAYPIETERLLLRPFARADHAALLAIHSREDLTRYLYWPPRGPEEVAEVLADKVACAKLEQEGDVLHLAAVLREEGTLVGDILLIWRSFVHRSAEVGFVFHPDHHGRGYATEATAALLRLGFEELGLHRIYGRLDARNAASARVLEKLGMRREAHLVENEWVKAEWTDEAIYGMLDREWEARAGPRAPARTGSSSGPRGRRR
jgi:RimJ/RimL family protein N-acetyltransferase